MTTDDLKKRKKALKLTVADLAYMADLPVSTVSKIMTGETKNPSYTTIEKLDRTLALEEMRVRIEAYKAALEAYVAGHPDEDIDEREFQRRYKEERGLSDVPIPYAVPHITKELTDGNLASGIPTRVSFDDFSNLAEDRYCELLDGCLIFNNAPNMQHQDIVQHLGRAIDTYISEHNGPCRMYNVGVNVRLGDRDDTVLIPDIAVLCDSDKTDDYGINGAPDWVIEVTSHSTRRRDYNDKMHKYMASGVREYWIVDPDKSRVTTYISGEPMMAYIYDFDDEIPVNIYDCALVIRMSVILS